MTDNRALWELVDEGLQYFDKAGDAGDKVYVKAIRQYIAILERPVVVWSADARKLGDEYFRMCKRDDKMPMAHGLWVEQLQEALESMVRGKS